MANGQCPVVEGSIEAAESKATEIVNQWRWTDAFLFGQSI
jgi:hypothetical protein